jgi:3-polyprenyl-4-hydroxybenzoate decarboxylase
MAWHYLEQAGVPNITGVWRGKWPETMRVQIRKSHRGHAQQVANALWGCHLGNYAAKHVIVVDEDIDIHDWEAIEWALCYRVNAGLGDVSFFAGTGGSMLDPSVPLEDRNSVKYGHGSWTRMLIDATKEEGRLLAEPGHQHDVAAQDDGDVGERGEVAVAAGGLAMACAIVNVSAATATTMRTSPSNKKVCKSPKSRPVVAAQTPTTSPAAKEIGKGVSINKPSRRAGVPTTILLAESFSLPVQSTTIPKIANAISSTGVAPFCHFRSGTR